MTKKNFQWNVAGGKRGGGNVINIRFNEKKNVMLNKMLHQFKWRTSRGNFSIEKLCKPLDVRCKREERMAAVAAKTSEVTQFQSRQMKSL